MKFGTTMPKRLILTLLITLECLLLLIAFAGWGTQGNEGQDQPIALGAIVTVVLAVGNALGLLTAFLAYSVILNRRRRRRDP